VTLPVFTGHVAGPVNGPSTQIVCIEPKLPDTGISLCSVALHIVIVSRIGLLIESRKFQLLPLHLATQLAVTPLEFHHVFGVRKLDSLGHHAVLIAQ